MTANDQGDPHQGWIVELRLAIDADSSDNARAIAEEVWQTMRVTAGSEPQITRSAGRASYWNIITDLDLSDLEPTIPEGAVIRFRYLTRNLPGVVFTGPAQSDPHTGLWQWLWQWLPDSWEMIWQQQEFVYPAVRAAGIRISVPAKKKRSSDFQGGDFSQRPNVTGAASAVVVGLPCRLVSVWCGARSCGK